MKHKIALSIFLIGIIALSTFAVTAHFLLIFTFRPPVYGAVSDPYPGRMTLYLRSSENYTGQGIFVMDDPTDPYWCAGDNGTHVLTGVYASMKIYTVDGDLLYGEPLHATGDWILKTDSGIVIWDWQFTDGNIGPIMGFALLTAIVICATVLWALVNKTLVGSAEMKKQ